MGRAAPGPHVSGFSTGQSRPYPLNSRNVSATIAATAAAYCHDCADEVPLWISVPATTTSRKRQPIPYQNRAYRFHAHSRHDALASISRFAA